MALCASLAKSGEFLVSDYMPWLAPEDDGEPVTTDEAPVIEMVKTRSRGVENYHGRSRVVILDPDDQLEPSQTPEEMKQVLVSIAKQHGTRPRKHPH